MKWLVNGIGSCGADVSSCLFVKLNSCMKQSIISIQWQHVSAAVCICLLVYRNYFRTHSIKVRLIPFARRRNKGNECPHFSSDFYECKRSVMHLQPLKNSVSCKWCNGNALILHTVKILSWFNSAEIFSAFADDSVQSAKTKRSLPYLRMSSWSLRWRNGKAISNGNVCHLVSAHSPMTSVGMISLIHG